MPHTCNSLPTISSKGARPSTRGGDLAARYLAAQLALLGFEPGGENGTYFQQVAIVESIVDPSFTLSAGPGAPFRYLEDVVGVQRRAGAAGADVRRAGLRRPRDRRA